MFIVVIMQVIGWLATYLEMVVVLPEHTGGTTRIYNILYENAIIIVPTPPPPNIYYMFIAVIRQEMGWLATYLEIVAILL